MITMADKKENINWFFEEKEITEITQMPKDVYGFCYKIEIQLEGKTFYYIGQKKLISQRKKKMSKKEIEALPNKKLKKWYYVFAEMKWQIYVGSSKELLSLIKEHGQDKLKLKKEILQYAYSENELKYIEAREILCSNSLLSDYYFNDGVSLRQVGKPNFAKNK